MEDIADSLDYNGTVVSAAAAREFLTANRQEIYGGPESELYCMSRRGLKEVLEDKAECISLGDLDFCVNTFPKHSGSGTLLHPFYHLLTPTIPSTICSRTDGPRHAPIPCRPRVLLSRGRLGGG